MGLLAFILLCLTRIAALLLSNQSEGPPEKVFNASTPVFAAPLGSAGLGCDSGQRDSENLGLVVGASFHGLLLSKRGSFWIWCVCKVPVKRRLCVLRSRAHRGQNSSVTSTEMGQCSTTDGSWLSAMHQLGAQGTGSELRKKQANVYTFTSTNIHTITHAQVVICTSISPHRNSCAQPLVTFRLYSV